MIVTVGWAIYPLGYVFGYLTGGVDAEFATKRDLQLS